MEGKLCCTLCRDNPVFNGPDSWKKHFQFFHGVYLNKGVDGGILCGLNGCAQRFKFFYNLRRHLTKVHSIPQQDALFSMPSLDRSCSVDHTDEEIGSSSLTTAGSSSVDQPAEVNLDTEPRDCFEETIPIYNLRSQAVRMVARFHTKPSVTGALVSEVVDECDELLMTHYHFLQREVYKYLEQKGELNDPKAKQLLGNFEYSSPFHGIRTQRQQMKVLKDHCKYIEPETIPLDNRINQALDRESTTYVPNPVKENYQYVSPIENFKLVLSNKAVRDAILSEQPSPEGILGSFIDGDFFKTNPFFFFASSSCHKDETLL